MSAEPAPEPLVVEQAVVADAVAMAEALRQGFVAMRDAVAAGRPIVVLVRDSDLLGQNSLEGAALATGLLGMARALATEGAGRGWRVNVVSHGEDGASVDETIAWLAQSGLSGQLVRATTDHLGAIWP